MYIMHICIYIYIKREIENAIEKIKLKTESSLCNGLVYTNKLARTHLKILCKSYTYKYHTRLDIYMPG